MLHGSFGICLHSAASVPFGPKRSKARNQSFVRVGSHFIVIELSRNRTLTPGVPRFVFTLERNLLTCGVAEWVANPGPGNLVSTSKEVRVALVLQSHDTV